MNPDPQQQQQQPAAAADNQIPAWFNASLPATPPEKPKKFNKRWVIIVSAVIVVFLAVLTLIVFAAQNSQTTTESACLSNNDYYDLTGIKSADTLETSSRFFTAEIGFKDSSTDYESTTFDTSASALLSRIAHFYTTHSKKSISIEIDADYSNENDYDLTMSRIQRVSTDLTNQGVPDELIITGTPLQVQPEDDSDTAATTSPSVTLSVKSDASCVAK